MTDESAIIALIREETEMLQDWNGVAGAAMEAAAGLADECRESGDKAEFRLSYASNLHEDDLSDTGKLEDDIRKTREDCRRASDEAEALKPRAATARNRY